MYALHRTNFLIAKRLEHTLAATSGLTFSQFLVLIPLKCRSNLAQSDIAEFLQLTEATVSRHIAQLGFSGHLKRAEDPENGRKYMLTLTPRGERAYTKALAVIEGELEKIFRIIPERDRAHLHKTLESINDYLITLK